MADIKVQYQVEDARARAHLIIQVCNQDPTIKLRDLSYLNKDELCALLVEKKKE